MHNGSLENHLFSRHRDFNPLSWVLRIKVALDAAKGIAFLHSDPVKVIYRDIKDPNILLDSDFNAKLSDFGLARDGPMGETSYVSTRVMGTFGYAAPEYVSTGHLNARSDVYSFGVVLLELLCGRQALDNNRLAKEQNLVDWARPYLTSRLILLFVDAYDAGEAHRSMKRRVFAGREITVVVDSESRKRPEEMRVKTRTRSREPSGSRGRSHGRSRSRSISRSRSPRRPSDSRSRYRSRSYSPAPRRRGADYSPSPRRRQEERPRSPPRGPPRGEEDGKYSRRSYSRSYVGDAAPDHYRNGDNEIREKPGYEPEERRRGGRVVSRSPSGSWSRSVEVSPR